MTQDLNGAATAAPAGLPAVNDTSDLAEVDRWLLDATATIPLVTDPQSALAVLDRVKCIEHAVQIQKLGQEREKAWGVVRLKAEARYGELLPSKQVGAPKGNRNAQKNNVTGGNVESGAQRKAQHQARKVAEAIKTDEGQEYIDTAERPSREGLLNATKDERQSRAASGPRHNLDRDPRVVEWVRCQMDKGLKRDQILEACASGEDGWPRPGAQLSKEKLKDIQEAIKRGDEAKQTTDEVRQDRARTSKTRMDHIVDQLEDRAGVSNEFREISRLAQALSLRLYRLDLNTLVDRSEPWIDKLLEGCFEDLVDVSESLELRIDGFQNRASDKAVRAKIAALRNTNGRPPAEAEIALAMADKLERKLKGPRLLPVKTA